MIRILRVQGRIPLSNIDTVMIRKPNHAANFIFGLGTLAGIVLATGVFRKRPPPKPTRVPGSSCPFIYSFDGKNYIFDAEPFGGAISPKLTRTDWCELQYLKEVNGQYKLLVRNELDETQYIDEIKIVVVDHPENAMAVPDIRGNIHSISEPVIPHSVYDQDGNDLMPYFGENDWVFWQSKNEGRDPDNIKDLKDELIFEFNKPEQAKKAKLVFNGTNTLWGSQTLKNYLKLYGTELPEFYQTIENQGSEFYKIQNAHLRDEFYSLQVKVETVNGWQTRGLIRGAGPFVSEDRVYVLNVSDIPGETLRIKLTPPAACWKINYLAVDYSKNSQIKVTEIEATKAVDHNGKNVLDTIYGRDKNYLIMPLIDDSAELTFRAPVKDLNLKRTLILKARGYYNIHLEVKGKYQKATLDKIHNEPGFALEYCFQEHLKWEKQIKTRLKHQ